MPARKLIHPIIAILAVVFILTSCLPAQNPVNPEETPCKGVSCLPPTLTPTYRPSPTLTPTVFLGQNRDAAYEKEITFWHSYPLHTLPVLTALIDEFNLENPDKIQVFQREFLTDDQLIDAISIAINEDALPDVIMAKNGLILTLFSIEQTIDLVDFISDPMIGLDGEQQKSINSIDWGAVTSEGKVAGIPAQKEAYFLLYNKTWANALGYDQPPVTLDDFSRQLSAAQAANSTLQDRNLRGTGGWIINWQPEIALNWMGTDFAFDGVDKMFSQEITQETFTELKTSQNAGFFWLARNSDPIPYFTQRLALMVSSSSSELPEMLIHMDKLQMKDEWVILPYPRISPDSGNILSLYSYGLPAKAFDEQLAGWIFIQWMMEPEHQAYLGVNQYTIPSDLLAVNQLSNFTPDTVLLDSIINLNDHYGLVPNHPEWIHGKPILADGFKQLFQPETTLDMIPDIIEQMDGMFADIQE